MFDLFASAAPQASLQKPFEPQIEPDSLQSRAVTKPEASGAQTIETVPSQRRWPTVQLTQPMRGLQVSSPQSMGFVWLVPSAPHV